MRISDWSSDGCSSDLRTGGEPCPHERRREARQRRDGPRLAGRAARPREAVMCDPFDPDTTPAPARREPSRRCRPLARSEEHTSELQSLMRISYAVFCLKKKNTNENL